jgi:hypothetical protein
MLAHNNLKKNNTNNITSNKYTDSCHLSCKSCCGTGFMKNFLYDIKNINALENNKYLTPYIICILCYGTGKKDYEKVFNYTCCLN